MAGTLIAPTPGSAQDFGAQAHFVLAGTGTENDGKAVPIAVGIDPLTGLPITAAGGPGSGGAITVADGANITQGTTTDPAWSGTGAGTLVAVLKAIWIRLRGGQATMANSLPVVLASDQGALNTRALASGTDSVAVVGTVTVVDSVALSVLLPTAQVAALTPVASAPVSLTAPAAALTASADTLFTFASQVKHLFLENKSAADAYYNLDVAASPGTYYLPAGALRILDLPCTILHLYSTAATPVNGATAANIAVGGWI